MSESGLWFLTILVNKRSSLPHNETSDIKQ